jgi:hypothetical protein
VSEVFEWRFAENEEFIRPKFFDLEIRAHIIAARRNRHTPIQIVTMNLRANTMPPTHGLIYLSAKRVYIAIIVWRIVLFAGANIPFLHCLIVLH